MNTELKNAVGATDKEAQYDESAKRLLGQKWILAHILVKTVDTFKGMRPGEVIRYIEGTPQISTVPAEPGLTNQKKETNGRRIVGFNTENGELESREKLQPVLEIIKKNYNFCKNQNALSELSSGKYKLSFAKKLDEALQLLNVYAFEYITEASNYNLDLKETLESILAAHGKELKKGLLHGSIDEIDTVLWECRVEWLTTAASNLV